MKFNSDHLTRQMDLIPLNVLGESITIIGAGAIGSWTALALAKMGFSNLTVFDGDNVSIENMNSQFYPFRSIGKPKVEALRELVFDFTGIRIETVNGFYLGNACPGIVISAVDSMDARKLIWENHKEKSFRTKAIIDPRMGAESAILYVMNPVNPKDIKAYENTLYTDDKAIQERCTAKATIYTANMLSGLVCKAVKDLLTRTDYVRVVNWNISENQMQAYKNVGTNL